MSTEKIAERVRKLLELSKSTNEHEASNAAARASQLMSEHNITSAMLAVQAEGKTQDEPIIKQAIAGRTEGARRVAWQEEVMCGVATALDCERFLWNGVYTVVGRASAVETWQTMCAYLFHTIDALADAAWLENGRDLAAVGVLPRTWKNSFKLGVAHVVHAKLASERKLIALQEADRVDGKALEAAREGFTDAAEVNANALVLTKQTLARIEAGLTAVKTEAKRITDELCASTGAKRKTARAVGTTTANTSGYAAGRQAGQNIDTKSRARGALKGGK